MGFDFVPGVIQSPPDHRDYIYGQMVGIEQLPTSFFWDRLPVRNQGSYGTCVGFASAAVKDRQEAKNYPSRGIRTSSLFVYEECKKQDGIPDQQGTYPRVAMKVLKDIGVCKEQTFPYSLLTDINRMPTPPQTAYDEAKQFVIGAYARVQTLDEIKHAIATQGPLLAGVLVAQNFIDAPNGVISAPEGRILGGHAICIDGYDDSRQMFRFANSWSENWGDGGYGWIPYSLINWRLDIGVPFFMEGWSSVDVILPPPKATKVELWIGRNTALVDGEEVFLDQPPIINPQAGRTLVPVRFLAEVLGWQVEWNGAERKVTLTRGDA